MSRHKLRNTDSMELQRLTSDQSGLDTQLDQQYPNLDSTPNPPVDDLRNQSKTQRCYTQGWRCGAVNCARATSLVFLFNLIATIWGSVYTRSNNGVILDGDCDRIKKLNAGLHLLINLIGTILLSSSNYCMQCLSAPTRNEVQRAHERGLWLDIGVPSFRNLRHISKRRVGLWVLLALSSLPIHLVYNSAVFSSISENSYIAFTVSQSFIDSPKCDGCNDLNENRTNLINRLHESARDGGLERLENIDCINEYAQMIQTSRRNVLVVTSDNKRALDDNAENFSIKVSTYDSYSWICSGLDSSLRCYQLIDEVRNNPQGWVVYSHPVQYCLSEKATPHCKLRLNLPVAILVTVLNLLKAVVMFYTAYRIKEEPLMTMGDAVASFMEQKDPTTKTMCLLTVRDFQKKHTGPFPTGSKQWMRIKHRWKDVTSKTRRITTLAMYIAVLILLSYLLRLGILQLPDSHSLPALARLGYGTVDVRTIISWPIEGTTSNIIMANLAQTILSALYFSYNGLLTCMLLGHEWSSYARHRKGLRVSRAPLGAQRSTYFLQLPYRFALPLMALSGVLHWLVSQSIFFVSIDNYSWTASFDWSWSTCGYSPIAIISVLVLAILMVLAIVGIGFVPFRPGINLAGSCSAAISAACHNSEWDGIDGHLSSSGKRRWSSRKRANSTRDVWKKIG
ncbi:hypothetical protein K505DRAFT_338477 [Melanomma pulvis-pyrius CBS 109.77]|uniref:DUF6536 domain-containing protein n=1 Tax=Melanomma pulvis-pyrius CBS 109.77 TaxID=1314802 RepID=A0A6A6X873_9PLEO|nr:hypothetical protein K505DRAFT_338477 [Melanomma pulvis-pyrius CBS 109.77]